MTVGLDDDDCWMEEGSGRKEDVMGKAPFGCEIVILGERGESLNGGIDRESRASWRLR